MGVRSVLAILGDPGRFEVILDWIRRRGVTVQVSDNRSDLIFVRTSDAAPDIVLLGLPLDRGAADLVAALRRHDPRVELVIVGADRDVASAAQAQALGARAWVEDPIDDRRELLFAIGLAIGSRDGDARLEGVYGADVARAAWSMLVAGTPVMAAVLDRARSLGDARCVLLSGELGTGKRTLARAVHFNGRRGHRPFIDVQCVRPAQLRDVLFGAHGALARAAGGAVCLDEIAGVPLDVQADLLAVIEDRRRDVQIFAATRRDLASMVGRGALRADLFHRLNAAALELPPLRERKADLVALATALLDRLASTHGVQLPRFAEDVAGALTGHAWPGNLHELRNELERILLLVDEDEIRAAHFRTGSTGRLATISADDHQLVVTVTGDRCPLDQLEREVIRHALLRTGGNISRAARYLAITRQTMLYRMKKHGFPSPSQPGV